MPHVASSNPIHGDASPPSRSDISSDPAAAMSADELAGSTPTRNIPDQSTNAGLAQDGTLPSSGNAVQRRPRPSSYLRLGLGARVSKINQATLVCCLVFLSRMMARAESPNPVLFARRDRCLAAYYRDELAVEGAWRAMVPCREPNAPARSSSSPGPSSYSGDSITPSLIALVWMHGCLMRTAGACLLSRRSIFAGRAPSFSVVQAASMLQLQFSGCRNVGLTQR